MRLKFSLGLKGNNGGKKRELKNPRGRGLCKRRGESRRPAMRI